MFEAIVLLVFGVVASYWIATRFHRKSSSTLRQSESRITGAVSREGSLTRRLVDSITDGLSDLLTEHSPGKQSPTALLAASPPKGESRRRPANPKGRDRVFLRMRTEFTETMLDFRGFTISLLDILRAIAPYIAIGSPPREVEEVLAKLVGTKRSLYYRSMSSMVDLVEHTEPDKKPSLLDVSMKRMISRYGSFAFESSMGIPLRDVLGPFITNGLIEVQGGEKDRLVYLTDTGSRFMAFLDEPLVLPPDQV